MKEKREDNGATIKPVAVELFAGAGGLSLGIARAGFDVILANEIEPNFAKTYALNHRKTKVLNEDIHNVDFLKEITKFGIRKIDLLSGGPPCQGFSTIGAKNISDPRNSLFHEFLRAAIELTPNYILFENVAGFAKMYSGTAHKALLSELQSMGYETATAVLNGSDFGLPQNRKRTIVVGWKKWLAKVELPKPTHFSDGNNRPEGCSKLALMDAISDLPIISTGMTAEKYLVEPKNEYQRFLRVGANVLTEHNVANYGIKMREILSLIPDGGTIDDVPERLRPKSYFSNTYARLLPDKPSPTITRNFGTPSSSRCVHPHQNRALSTREGARLQGFPDNYVFIGSKTSKNLQIGNAVPPIFGEIVARQILLSMHGSQ